MKEITEPETRVDWSRPKATDDSGEELRIICSRPSGDLFPVPSTTEVVCTATDSAGNRATCSFRITLKRKLKLLHLNKQFLKMILLSKRKG